MTEQKKFKIAVLVSGNGSNLQKIIDSIHKKELMNVEISQVIADRNCFAMERALDEDIETFIVERGGNISVEIEEYLDSETDLIVLAGFLSILSEEFCKKWERKIINIHPSLLPKYGGAGMYGKKVHQAVLANHEKESGATVHYVTFGIDEGEIILQKTIKIKPNETADWLATKVHEVEYEILIEVLKMLSKSN